MISLWVFLGGITLYIIGAFLEWLADQLHGDRKGGNQMIVNQYDDVLLTDGRMAGIVEKFSETEFLADVGSSPEDWDTIFVTLDEIEKVLRAH